MRNPVRICHVGNLQSLKEKNPPQISAKSKGRLIRRVPCGRARLWNGSRCTKSGFFFILFLSKEVEGYKKAAVNFFWWLIWAARRVERKRKWNSNQLVSEFECDTTQSLSQTTKMISCLFQSTLLLLLLLSFCSNQTHNCKCSHIIKRFNGTIAVTTEGRTFWRPCATAESTGPVSSEWCKTGTATANLFFVTN